jgi:hypothetical protein
MQRTSESESFSHTHVVMHACITSNQENIGYAAILIHVDHTDLITVMYTERFGLARASKLFAFKQYANLSFRTGSSGRKTVCWSKYPAANSLCINTVI